MLKPLLGKRSTSAATKLRAAQMSVTPVLRAKEASMAGRKWLPKRRRAVVRPEERIAALGFSVTAASS